MIRLKENSQKTDRKGTGIMKENRYELNKQLAQMLKGGVIMDVTTPEQAKASVREIGISFLFAQSYHGAMKYVAPARKELGIRTVFNVLGPLTNPASTNYILLGVYEKAMLPVMARVLLGLGIKSAMIVYGNDRLDEVSISDKTSVAEVRDGKITEYEIAPEDFGFPRASKELIVGCIAELNAKISGGILDGSFRGA